MSAHSSVDPERDRDIVSGAAFSLLYTILVMGSVISESSIMMEITGLLVIVLALSGGALWLVDNLSIRSYWSSMSMVRYTLPLMVVIQVLVLASSGWWFLAALRLLTLANEMVRVRMAM